MLDKLTQEQKDAMPKYVDNWTKIGLSTEPANRVEAEKAINQIYTIGGQTVPKRIIWCDSPVTQGLSWAILVNLVDKSNSNNTSLERELTSILTDFLNYKDLSLSIVDSVLNTVREFLTPDKSIDVKNLKENFKSLVNDSISNAGYGQHDAHWLAFYDFFRNECNLIKETKKVTGLIELAKHAGWWLPCVDVCFVSERPYLLNRDDQGRFHSHTQPVIAFKDGFKHYASHGVRLPSWIIENKNTITAQKIDNESNLEIKRVMLELYGINRYIENSECELIDRDIDSKGEVRELLRKRVKNDDDILAMKVVNSSLEPDGRKKVYFIPVDMECRPIFPNLKNNELDKAIKDAESLSREERIEKGYLGKPQQLTCHNAIASTFGKYGKHYGLDGQTRQGDVFIEMKTGNSTKLKFRES